MRAFLRLCRIAAGLETAANRTVRVLIEIAHILIGILAAALIAAAAAWSYPRATQDIWLVTFVAMALVVLMGIGPIRRAYAPEPAHPNPSETRTHG
jgi:hypothetical protein